MEIHQLRYFVAVAQCGSFSRAAEHCCVSQPSLSQSIQKLERGLGQRLFERLGRQVLLTDAGRRLLDRATSILSALDDTEKLLRETDAQSGGHLEIGAIPTMAPYLLPPLLERFLHEWPRAEVTVQEDVTAHLIEAVAAAELDLALLSLPVSDDRLHVETLFAEPLFVAMDRRHPLASKRHITLDDIRDERFILLREMHCLGDQVLTFCRASGCEPRVGCRSAQIATIQALIAAGQGISLLPDMARRADKDGRCVYREFAGGGLTRSVAVISHRSRFRGPTAERFLGLLRRFAGEQSK